MGAAPVRLWALLRGAALTVAPPCGLVAGTFKTTIPDVTLAGDAATSLFHAGGTSVVIHEKADDTNTDPAGNAGARIACGVIQ